MAIRRTKHAVYDLKYHLVWIPKYRKEIFTLEIAEYLKEVFQHIAGEFEFHIDAMEIMVDLSTSLPKLLPDILRLRLYR